MKWFKHMTDSLDDPFIHALMDEFGATGYLAFFGLIEIIGKENGHTVTGKLTINPTYLRRKLRTSQGKLRQVYDFCQTFGKLSVNFSEKLWEFNFIKMMEIKDNYTKDLQATGKKLSLEEEEEEEVEKKPKKKKAPLIPKGFDIFWEAWPTGKKKSKGQALKTWKKISPGKNLLQAILNGLKNAKASKEWAEEEGRFIPHPSTWLNNMGWEDEYTSISGRPAQKVCTKENPMPKEDRGSWRHPEYQTSKDGHSHRCKNCRTVF